ncbi:unnamed protein product [Schistosoma curassoni]|uniref:GINS complex subunit 2 n=1 Tax=Schistosoma curassoni TaxID=6186 RepID=A0A183JDJ6_9TREM|nr:unnamed protein product [Schistosoma curassoni]
MDIEALHTDIPIGLPLWLIKVITMVVRQIKRGKADGPENIPDEALVSDIEMTVNILHVLFREITEEGQVPSTLKEQYLIKMSRKGDLSKYENYRNITLQSIRGNFLKSVAEINERFARRSSLRLA